MINVSCTITLTLEGPVLTQASAPGIPGVDAPMARTAGGRLYLPYSLVKGRLREALLGLAELQADLRPRVEDWLGPDPSSSRPGNRPRRARMRLHDFFATRQVAESDSGIGHRIQMDPERGAGKHGQLQFSERPFNPGERVRFAGALKFTAGDPAESKEILGWIDKGLRWVTGFGADRTTGFGRLLAVEIDQSAGDGEHAGRPVAATAAPSAGATPVLGLRLRFRSPFCIARRRVAQNLFESETVVPGAALKGALATQINSLLGRPLGQDIHGPLPLWPRLGDYFSLIRFTHAFPARAGSTTRPVVAPLSLVKYRGQTGWEDVALRDGPAISARGRAGAFSVDWKDSSDVREAFGWGENKPARELRVRTAISGKRRRAEETALFSYEMVVPDGFDWLASIDLTAIKDSEDCQAVAADLRDVLGRGLGFIGKTKADADVDVSDAPSPSVLQGHEHAIPGPLAGEKLWVLTLQSPGLLCDPRTLNERSTGDDLHAAYDAVWRELSDNSLGLKCFFAQQSLAGGYLVHRFQPPDPAQDKPYRPFLLTDAGSVFVLTLQPGATESTAGPLMKEWRARGLPLPHWAKTLYGSSWETCPFVRENGFGEVAVNLPCPTPVPLPAARQIAEGASHV